MKKLLTALSVVLCLSFAGAQQTAPSSTSKMQKMKPKTGAKMVKPEKKMMAAKPAISSGVKMKKDGTPDKRYKTSQHLKKDGTPDKRYK
ncbi:hypothetical protein [Halpernia frigidisoli]|uniref:Uncharacterized protein n=1 Tax=Halpernia frigidisoli TaxID=1125876 RepID=A0A1I3GN97_9FLAO|nr:hypothetical protein [Halpernia frigidisoli]SFI24893.1 hypothetical protein SAMN05443292_1936 [Halpernia frigidisoli]